MKLFQYWDTGEPPDEVACWIESLRAMNSDLQHRLFSRDEATWFIKKHFGLRQRLAFEAIAVPAMQADYFRACAVLARGGAFVDADSVAEVPLRTLFERAPHSLMMTWADDLQPGLMMFRTPGDALLAAWLEKMTSNIEHRVPGNVSELTGPMAITAIYSQAMKNDVGPVSVSARQLTTVPWSEVGPWIGLPSPSYKKGERHWRNWKGPKYNTQHL